ncbi:MAG: hypothetical protein L0Z62_02925, partial [Gemmataceae bacterium]|nr:hypothetical protein [Gemmataceae bacterium]
CYLENVALQGTMVQGLRDVPFVRQYIGTTPFLYYIEMQLRWGMGLLLGLAAFGGFAWAVGVTKAKASAKVLNTAPPLSNRNCMGSSCCTGCESCRNLL